MSMRIDLDLEWRKNQRMNMERESKNEYEKSLS